MRINLVTPFAEKDTVKALGARWDPAKKLWYIKDVADITPFHRWIPDLAAVTENSAGQLASLAVGGVSAPIRRSEGIVTKSGVAVAHCGCQVLPWEDCGHTAGKG